MVDVIRSFQYKTAGRGKGVLGLKDLAPSRRPGENKTTTVNQTAARDVAGKRPTTTSGERGAAKQRSAAVVLYNYTANPGSPGGFPELTVKSGQLARAHSRMHACMHTH
jgi:hypothetical protein